MNKHAQNLRAMMALLPVEVCHVYRDTIHDAVIEIERLDTELAKHRMPTVVSCSRPGAEDGASCPHPEQACESCGNAIMGCAL